MKNSLNKISTLTTALALALSLIGAQDARAGNIYKAATGADLTDGASWTNGVPPGSADVATWSSGSLGGTTLTLGSGVSWLGISMTAATADPTIPAPGPLTLGASGIDLSSSANSMTINAAITLGANQTWTVNSAKTLTVGGTVSGSGITLTKAGAGTLTLNGSSANTYTGTTTINAGTLVLNKTAGVNAIAGNITLGDGTGGDILQLTQNDQIADTSVITLVGSAAGNRGWLQMNTKSDTIGGLSSSAAGNGLVANEGATDSTLTLSLASSTTQTFSGLIRNGNATVGKLAIVKTGTGTQVISGANTYTGGTIVSNGVLDLQTSGAAGSSSGSVLVSAGALQLDGSSLNVANALTLNGAGVSAGGALRNLANANTYSGAITLGSAARINTDAGTLTLSSGTAMTGAYGLTIGGSGNTTVSSGGIGSQIASLTKDGSGTLTLSASNAFTGIATVSSGTLAMTFGNGLNNSTNLSVAAGATFDVTSIIGYAFKSGQALTASGTGMTVGTTAAELKAASGGTFTLSAANNNTITLTWGGSTSGSDSTHPALYVSQGTLSLSSPAFVINSSSPLAVGTYTLISVASGSITGSGVTSSTLSGTAVGVANRIYKLSISGGTVLLTVMDATATACSRTSGTSPQTYGSTLTFTATVTNSAGGATPTGNVIFKTNGTAVASVALSSGSAVYTSFTDVKVAGEAWNVTAYYQGDSTHDISDSSASPISQTITAKALTAQGTLSGGGKIYDGTTTATPSGSAALQSTEAPDAGTTADGKPYNSDSVSLTGTASYNFNSQDVPTATTISVSGLSLTGTGSGNYTLTVPTLSANISQANLMVTANNDTKTYGQGKTYGVGSMNFTSAGLQNLETIGSVTITASGGTATNDPVNTYSLTPSAAAGGTFNPSNYSITYTDGTLTVNPASLLVQADNTNRVYGAANPVFTTSYSGFVNGEILGTSDVGGLPALTTTADTNSPAGSYDIVTTLGSLTSSNYSFVLSNGILTVAVATLGVTANNASKTYDGTGYTGGNDVTYSGFVNGETSSVLGGALSYGGTSQGATNAGSYSIIPSGLTGGNYSISYTNGTLTVNPLAIAVTAVATIKVYGQIDPALNYDFTPALVVGDSFSGALTRVAGENVGSHAIQQGTLALSANYTLNYTGANLTINPAFLGITANSSSKAYGQSVTFAGTEFSVDGLVGSDSVSSVTLTSTGATNTAAVGSYSIVPSAAVGTGLGNYSITYTNGTLTVNQATPVTVNSPVVLNDGNIQLTFTGGDTGVSYQIQATSDLSSPTWNILATNVATMSGLPNFTDLVATNYPIRFYRTMIH